MYKTIKFFRHGETTWNMEKRLQGWLDSPLTVQGRTQIQSQLWKADYVISSDLGRAFETAQLLFPQQAIHTDQRLREIYLGEWQGCSIIDLQHTEEYKCYSNTPHLFCPSTQESFESVTARMQNVFQELLLLPYENIAVVSHGVAIACFMNFYEEDTRQNIWQYLLLGGESFTIQVLCESTKLIREKTE
ncbi:MAG: histidine phosphatase family protein [Solibacillus sp.]|uniref:histidine phosphatase family protein n=1 Tax=Solibacillus sp. TaxID=1909654 RepID=UPI003314D5F3